LACYIPTTLHTSRAGRALTDFVHATTAVSGRARHTASLECRRESMQRSDEVEWVDSLAFMQWTAHELLYTQQHPVSLTHDTSTTAVSFSFGKSATNSPRLRVDRMKFDCTSEVSLRGSFYSVADRLICRQCFDTVRWEEHPACKNDR